MKLSLKTTAIVIGSTIVIAILLDAFIVSPNAPWISHLLGIELDIILFGTPFSIPRFGIVLPYAMLLLASAVLLVPIGSWRSAATWKVRGRTWLQVLKWTLAAPVLVITGHFIYVLVADYLPDWLKALAESFGVAARVFIGDHEFFPLDGSLATLLGLAAGVYLFLNYGVKRGLERAKHEIQQILEQVKKSSENDREKPDQ